MYILNNYCSVDTRWWMIVVQGHVPMTINLIPKMYGDSTGLCESPMDDLLYPDYTRNMNNLTLWWRTSMEAFSALLSLCEGNLPVTGGFPHKGQWRGAFMCSLAWTNGGANSRWFETPLGLLWRHCYDAIFVHSCSLSWQHSCFRDHCFRHGLFTELKIKYNQARSLVKYLNALVTESESCACQVLLS